jgi:5'-AMP-activated protein kinase regulatory beta subunit
VINFLLLYFFLDKYISISINYYRYKFIVDGEWRFSPEDATMSDDNGYINNYIDTTNF